MMRLQLFVTMFFFVLVSVGIESVAEIQSNSSDNAAQMGLYSYGKSLVIIAANENKAKKTPVKKLKLKEFRDCPECPKMVVLPPGTFIMGNDQGHVSEKPAHKVSIKYAFAIGKFEITIKQWKACVNGGICSLKPVRVSSGKYSQIADISWRDAKEYVRWLSKKTDQKYRLPTESEWEYAARAGTQTRFWWGDEVGVANANCKDCGGNWDYQAPAELDAFADNPFGLYGVNGGVWEWVSDCWHRSFKGAPNDGSDWEKADCRQHVIRGGSWRNDSSYVQSASRFKYDGDVRYILHGFRVAKTLED